MYDADQLPGSIVYSILEDDRGRLWLGTNQGLVRFSPDTRQFRRYGTRDGLVNREFNRRAALRGQDGQLFFGGLRGVTAFDPDAIRENPYVPPVVITRMTKENRSSPVPINPYGRDQVALDYRDRVFTVGFAALNFTSPENNRYRYQLDGFEDDWVEAGTRRVVRYTNVPPGAYVFRVQGSNNDGIWNKEGASIRVSIDPPFWRTGWFQFLIGVLIAGVLVAMYRVRVRHLLRIERLRLRIARDLHDDVASQLASVAIRSDLLRVTAELTADERAELRQMGSLVRQTTETLRDIVWFVDPEHDRPGALVEKMKTTASRLLGGLEYRFDASAPDEHDCLRALDVRGRRNLFLIYKEALHNIARHAAAKTVQVTVRCPPETLELTICDDGTGFIPEDQSTWGTGMKSMRRRAEQIGADLKISSEPDRGTTLCLRVPAP
jgi:signal transduction histidine kinase